jgi:hypothetical protein
MTAAAANRNSHECPHHDRLEAKLDLVLSRLGQGDTTFATHELRVRSLEKLVYGAVAVGLTAIVVSVVGLVVSPVANLRIPIPPLPPAPIPENHASR